MSDNSILNYAPGKLRIQQEKALLEIEAKFQHNDVFVITAPTACHAKGQEVLMFDGSLKKVEDIVVGDQLMGPDSKPRTVLELFNGIDDLVTIVPKWGRPWTVTHNHILSLHRYADSTRESGKITITCSDWLEKSNSFKYETTLWKPDIPMKCVRKNCRFTIEPAGRGEYFGFELDGDHLYLLDDFTVTHNTGKSWLAITIAKWLESKGEQTAIVTPTKLLQDQYNEEFPEYPNLKGRSSYQCIKKPESTCEKESLRSANGKSFRKHCPECPYAQTKKRCQEESVIFANYHTFFSNKLHRPNLIVDEAHNTIQVLTDMFSIELWQHVDNFPKQIDHLGDLAVWMENRIKCLEDLKSQDKLSKKDDTRLLNYKTCINEIMYNARNYHFECNVKRYRGEMRKQIVIKPMSPRHVPAILWPRSKVDKIILLSATLQKKDIEELGLHHRRVVYIDCDSPIPAENRQFVVTNEVDMGYWNRVNAIPVLVQILDDMADKHPDKGIIHVTYAVARSLKSLLKNDRFMFHTQTTKMKVYNAFRESKKNPILVASGMSEGIDLVEDAGRWQVIPMIPYVNMTDPWVKQKMTIDPVWYNWIAIRTIQQQTGRICRTPTDTGVTYMLDSRFAKLFYRTVDLWPDWFKESIKWKA